METLNPAQAQAIASRTRQVLVSAGAGAGKTRVLTTRYLDLLTREHLTVEQILTLTFTRKAAQEMRGRIAEQLLHRGMLHERRALSRAPIGTIHSFCERILREYALLAGLDPHFRLLDEAEAGTMLENALDAVFEDVWAGAQQERVQIGRLLLDYPHATLRGALLGHFTRARGWGLAPSALRPAPPPDPRPLARDLAAAIEELLALEGTVKWLEQLRVAAAAYAQLRPLLAEPWGTFSWEHYDALEAFLAPLTPGGGPKERAKAARNAVKEAFHAWRDSYLDLAVQPYLRAFILLLARLDTVYAEMKRAQGLVDFADLLLRTRALLQSAAGAAVASRYRKQFREIMVDEFQDTNPLQFGIISALWGDGRLFTVGDVKQSIYRFMGSDVTVFLGQERAVADAGTEGERIPLAINYRTRREILAPLNRLFAGLWGREPHADGFRFEPLEAGRTFLPAAEPAIEIAFRTDRARQADGDGIAALRDHESAWIARRILQMTGQLGDAPLRLTARAHGDGIPAARAATFKDITLLFTASTNIPRYEEALRTAGIPFYTVSGRGFYDTREVQDVIHLLRVLENPLDDFSLAAVLRSPFLGVSAEALYWLTREWASWTPAAPYPAERDRERRYGHLWTNLARVRDIPALPERAREELAAFHAQLGALQASLPAGQPLDLLDRIFALTGYATALPAGEAGEQQYANIRKLRDIAATFQQRGIFDLTDFQRYLQQAAQYASREAAAPLEVEQSDVVRLMTIHAAKGLEAPVIFLADCGRATRLDADVFLLREDGTLACKLYAPDEAWAQPLGFRETLAAQTAAERREAERLLYVALTRAQEHLVLSGAATYRGWASRRYADLVAEQLGLAAAPEEDLLLDGAIRVWSEASLTRLAETPPPAQAPTLFETHGAAILAGQPLPLAPAPAALTHFTETTKRFGPLPAARRAGPLRVGVHRVLCYDTCPRQYWFRYILHHEGGPASLLPPLAEELPVPDDDPRARTDGTAFGTLWHHVMEAIDFSGPLTLQLPAIVQRLVETRGMTVPPADHAALASCLQRLEASPLPARLRRAELQREVPFLAREGDVFISGIIDLLARDAGAWWIVDWKTGRRSAAHLRQVLLYALGVQGSLGLTPAGVLLAYVEEADLVREERVTTALLDDARWRVRRVGEGLLREMGAPSYAPTAGRWCAHCPYQGGCPEGMLAAATAEDRATAT